MKRPIPLFFLSCLLFPGIVAAAALSTTWQNFTDAQTSGTEPILPDFSYAGYHRSEVDLPTVAGPIFDVTDYGAVPDDYRSDRDAIQAAILAAEASGGGVVFFPPGRFHLNTRSEVGSPIRIRESHIVLRGSGPWAGGTELYMEEKFEPANPAQLYSTPEMFLIQPSTTAAAQLSTITAAATRETFAIEVSNPSNFAVGDWITVFLQDPDAVADALAPKVAQPEWTRLVDGGLAIREKHQVAAVEGNTLTLAEPLHYTIDPTYDWRVFRYPNIEEIGIEDIAFRGNWLGNFVHHRSALDDSAWSCLQINYVTNGWIQRCRFINWNEAVNLHDTSLFTLLHTRIEGNPGHFGIHTRRGYGVLAALSDDRASQWHGPSVGYQSAGSVFWRYDHAADSSADAHGNGPYATLHDAGSGGFFTGRTGGPLEGQPNHMRWFTQWNTNQTSPSRFADPWADNATTRDRFLFPLWIGTKGATNTWDTADLQVLESNGAPVDPDSLFEAQLELRLGSLPAFIENWKSAWSTWQAQPSETVVRISSSGELEGALSTAEPGTRIVFENGVYRSQGLNLNGRLTPNGMGGTADWPITLCAETPGEVYFVGSSQLNFGGSHMVAEGFVFTLGSATGGSIIAFETSSSNQATDCALVNCAIVEFNPDDRSTDYDWISVEGQRNRVEYCAFTGMNHKGVQMVVWLDADATPAAPVIRGNYFADRATGSGNGYETIRIGTSDRSLLRSEALVEGNLFERCDGEIEIISNKSVGNIYRGNTFRENDGQLTLRHGADCLVDGNFFFGENKSGSSGVRVIGPDHTVINNHFEGLRGNSNLRAAITLMNGVPNSPLNRYEPLTNALIAHNTFVDCDDAINIGTESSEGDATVPPTNTVFANNVILNSASPHFRYFNTPTNFSYLGHVFWGGTSGLPVEADATNVDPLLVADSEGIYRPAANSPLLDAAVDSAVGEVVTDLDGQPRPATGRDIGADEVSTAPRRYRPLERPDVGPSWPIVIPDIGGPGTGTFIEDFNYADGTLRNNAFWGDSGTTASRTAEHTDAIQIADNELVMILDGGAGTAIGNVFTPLFENEPLSSGDLFASFHFRVDSLPASGAQSEYIAAFSTDDGNVLRGRLWITGQNPTEQTYRLGITSKTGSPFAIVEAAPPLDVGTTYGVILQHSYDASNTETRLYLDATAPVDPSTVEGSSAGNPLNGFSFRSDNSPVATITIDNLRAGYSFDEVLNPVRDPFGGVRFEDSRWYYREPTGWYYRHPAGHLFLPQLGWVWYHVDSFSASTQFYYDFTLDSWCFTNDSIYPWIYVYGAVSGFYYIDPESTYDNRLLTPAL